MRVHLDFETRSLADIKVTGAYKYAQDSSTDILCVAYAFDNTMVELWTPDMPVPKDLWNAAIDVWCDFHAFNVGFERRIWKFVMVDKYGWPEVPTHKWYDTQADAAAMGFPLDLNRCAKALHVKYEKDGSGTRLINMLSKPISGTTKFREKKDHLQLYLDLYEYCKQDVRVERALSQKFTVETTCKGQERDIFLLTEKLNDNGIPIDTTLVNAFYSLIEVVMKDEAIEHLEEMSDGKIQSGNQTQAMNAALDQPLPDFQKKTIENALTCPLLSDHDRAIMEARMLFANTSTAKYAKMVNMMCKDGVVRDTFQYHAAAPGRFGGRGIQPQNFPRSSPKDADQIARFVCDPDKEIEDIEDKYGPLQEVAKSMLRPSLRAPYGETFVCYDYSAIEACGVAWGTLDEKQLEVFRSGRDIYIATAAEMYDIAYEEVTSAQRQPGKISVLACGYQGGWKALRDFAIGYGVYWTPKESWNIVQDFRRTRPKMVAAWKEFDDTAMAALRNPGQEFAVLDVQSCLFMMKDKHLRMTLPNGKYLWFPYAEIGPITRIDPVTKEEKIGIKYLTPDGETKIITGDCVTHMWINNGNQWVRRGIHGGSLFQSYIQAICRELMIEAMLRLDKAGWPLNGTVHDEIFGVVSDEQAERHEEFRDIMTQVPAWAEGFPIKASGWVGRRYRK